MRTASGLPSPERIGSALETAVMSSTPARAITGCIASVTGLFQPSMITATPELTSSVARDTPTAGVDSSSRMTSSIFRPSTPPLSLITAAIAWMACVTCWPCGPAPPDSGKISADLDGVLRLCGGAQPEGQGPRRPANLRIDFIVSVSLQSLTTGYF